MALIANYFYIYYSGHVPTIYQECKHFIVGDGCLIGLNFTNHVDIVIILDTSNSINENEFNMLTSSLSTAIRTKFPTDDDMQNAMTM